MKKLTLLLLLLVSTSVFAEWTKVSGTDDVTTYVDYGTIKRKGNKVKMWSLYDFKTIQRWGNSSFLSQINHIEFDCEEEAERNLDYFLYLGNQGGGEVVYSQTNRKYETSSIIPGSIGETNFKIACDKK